MDHYMRCNALTCRSQLKDKAVVTTCSCYQEFLSKNFTEKYTGLKTETDKAAFNANSEISSLRKKVLDLEASQDELKKKNQELVNQCREKSKRLSQMTTLYNLLKARTLHSQMETAAADSVAKTLRTTSSRSDQPDIATPSGSSYAPSISTISRASFPRASPSRESVSRISLPRTTFPVDADGVEQLHPFQKSGSAGSGSSSRSNLVSKTPVKDTSMGPPIWPASWTRSRSLHHRTRLPRGSSRPSSRGTIRPEVLAAGFGKPFDIEAPNH
ncbi:cyclin [Penicillium herquei]|nr:cyclin [Penicillium herquei]